VLIGFSTTSFTYEFVSCISISKASEETKSHRIPPLTILLEFISRLHFQLWGVVNVSYPAPHSMPTMRVHTSPNEFPPGTILLEGSKPSLLFGNPRDLDTYYHIGNNSQTEIILSPTPSDEPDDPLARICPRYRAHTKANSRTRIGLPLEKQSISG
jgi:hypothetical protein